MSLSKVIRDYRTKHDLSLRAFAAKCGLSHGYVDQLEKNADPRSGKSPQPTIETLQALATGMEIPLNELLTRAGILDQPTDIELEELLRRSDIHFQLGGRTLTEEEKADVLAFLRFALKIGRKE